MVQIRTAHQHNRSRPYRRRTGAGKARRGDTAEPRPHGSRRVQQPAPPRTGDGRAGGPDGRRGHAATFGVGLRRLRRAGPPTTFALSHPAGWSGPTAVPEASRSIRSAGAPTGRSISHWSRCATTTSCSSGHGHFSRSVVTRWVEQPLREGARYGFGPASAAVCGFDYGLRQLKSLGLTTHREPDSAT